ALRSPSMEEEKSRPGGKQNKDNDDFMPWNSLRFNDRRRSRCGRGNLAKLLRRLGIAQGLRVKIHQMETHSMPDLAFPQVAQTRRPLPVLHQIIRHVLGEKNVSGVAAI